MFPHLHNIVQEFCRHSIKTLGFYRRGFEARVTQQGDVKQGEVRRWNKDPGIGWRVQLYGNPGSDVWSDSKDILHFELKNKKKINL